MDLRLTEEQRILTRTARSFLEEDTKGYSESLWKKMVDLGWTGLPIPEQFGGVGGDFFDLILLLEEMGRALVPSPFFPTVVLGALSILRWGTDRQRQDILPGIAKGTIKATLAYIEGTFIRHDLSLIGLPAKRRSEEFVLDGRKLFVP
ncbi:MAG: acyl-CoA dehydrogenase family protein, partial [Candidatus Methanomethylicaceae archaeon]